MSTRGRYINDRTAFFFNSISKELMDIEGQSVLYYELLVNKIANVDKYSSVYKESDKKKYLTPKTIIAKVDIDKKTTETFEEAKFERKTTIRISFNRESLKEISVVPMEGDIVCFQNMFFELYMVDDTEMHMGSPEFKYSINVEGHQIRIDNNKMVLGVDNEL